MQNQEHSIASIKLNNGFTIPQLGLGTYRMTDRSLALKAFAFAIEKGYRHFDTASLYENEAIIGEAIRNSGINRAEFFITSKLWNDDQGYDRAKRAIYRSNEEIGLGYIDLYLIHWPVSKYRLESWRALEESLKEGICHSIGVSNYMANHLRELYENCTVFPAVNQIELHPFNYLSRSDTLELCSEKGVIPAAYCPLTRGQKLNDPKLLHLAAQYGKTPAQILIRWGIDHGFCEIPKSANPARIEENISVFDFELSEEDLATIDSWDKNLSVSWDPSKVD
ncbi:MAG: aldo/keto reductase [Flavobacteriales bacterium]|nr:aldo/keto reductase [Flavobacteriales bacterium]